MNTKQRFTNPFFSLIAFSVYSGIMGAVLLFAPRIVLPMLRIEGEINPYTYMLGFVLLASSFYYVSSGIAGNRHFAGLTVYTRLASPVVTVTLFLGGNAPVNFVILSIVDCLCCLWTLSALRRNDQKKPL